MDIEDVRRRLMLSITGALAAGCGPSVPPDGEDGSATSSAVGSSSSATDTGVASTSASTTRATTADGGTDEPPRPKYDIGEIPDFPSGDCPSQPMPPQEECTAELPNEASYFLFYCVDAPPEGTCETWAGELELHDWDITQCLLMDSCRGPAVQQIGCGPLPDAGDQCCFWFIVEDGFFCPGRPFVVAGRERLAELSERDDWKAELALALAAPPHRAAIAAAWAEQAAFEHASIASFSRFVLQLLACGAPARLLSKAQRALGEEIEHAQLFFGFASHYAGRALGPAALATHDALAGADDLDAVVLSAVREGCIAETISAWHVALVAASARDPAMARALARVAEQELEHAALAWEFLAWALPRASEALRRRIEATLDDAARFAPRGPSLAITVGPDEWLAHGILPADVHAGATRHALHELVAPLARSLVNTVPTRPRASTTLPRPSA